MQAPAIQQPITFQKGSTANFIQTYRDSTRTESKTEGAQVKLTATQKTALKAICDETGKGVSTFIAEALDKRIENMPIDDVIEAVRPYVDKFRKHRTVLLSLLQSLP